jgi:hypothetical protein
VHFLHKVGTYIPRVTQYRYLRPNWDPPTPPLQQASLSPPRNKGGGTHSPAGEGVGRPNLDDWRKILARKGKDSSHGDFAPDPFLIYEENWTNFFLNQCTQYLAIRRILGIQTGSN